MIPLFDRSGVRATPLTRPHPEPEYKGQVQCIGYEATINGLRYSTVDATLLSGPNEDFNTPHHQRSLGTRLYRTPNDRFFTLANGRIDPISSTAAMDVYGQSYKKQVSEAEAFGNEIPLA